MRTASLAKVPRVNESIVRELVSALTDSAAGPRAGYYLREIAGDLYLLHYAEIDSSREPIGLPDKLAARVVPLPHAAANGRVLEPMELVFYDAGAADKQPDAEVTRIAMLTGLRTEKEKDYRLLHGNPWPDVLAAIRRANLRHFSIFLEEINGELYLFGWLEYVGSDIEADTAANKKDPASIRWWKETDACQIAPVDADGGMWGEVEELIFFDE